MNDLAALLVQVADRAVEQVCRYAVIGSATLKSRLHRVHHGCPIDDSAKMGRIVCFDRIKGGGVLRRVLKKRLFIFAWNY